MHGLTRPLLCTVLPDQTFYAGPIICFAESGLGLGQIFSFYLDRAKNSSCMGQVRAELLFLITGRIELLAFIPDQYLFLFIYFVWIGPGTGLRNSDLRSFIILLYQEMRKKLITKMLPLYI